MVDEVKLLLAPEPSKACEPRSFGVVLLVKIYVRREQHHAGGDRYGKQIQWKNQLHPTGNQDGRDKKIGRVVSIVATISGGHQMALGIVRMMKSYVIPIEDTAYSMMAKAVMEQGLANRYDEMSADRS
jgi:hypothetical protein